MSKQARKGGKSFMKNYCRPTGWQKRCGNLAFIMAKEIVAQVGCEVVVLNPGKLALIYGSMKKTDKEDSLKLARLVQKYDNSELPTVSVPSDQEMDRRELLREEQVGDTRANAAP
jgi:transposase